MNYESISKTTVGHIYAAYHSLSNSPLDQKIRLLVELRVSQINECRYCCKLHTADALKLGVTQIQIDSLKNWKSSTEFDKRQKLVLSLCEEITLHNRADASLKQKMMEYFDEREFVDLTLTISLMNALNRIAINLR